MAVLARTVQTHPLSRLTRERPSSCRAAIEADAGKARRVLPGRAWLSISLMLILLNAAAPASDSPPTATSQQSAPAADPGNPLATAAPARAAPQDTASPHDGTPRWLDAVREQRRALQERRRAQHQARRRAIDPVGTALHEAQEQEFLRRRREMRDMLAENRRLFLNLGPWLTPWPAPPGSMPTAPTPAPHDAQAAPGQVQTDLPPQPYELPNWDNGWYFHGW
jgi:hypothetical protein